MTPQEAADHAAALGYDYIKQGRSGGWVMYKSGTPFSAVIFAQIEYSGDWRDSLTKGKV